MPCPVCEHFAYPCHRHSRYFCYRQGCGKNKLSPTGWCSPCKSVIRIALLSSHISHTYEIVMTYIGCFEARQDREIWKQMQTDQELLVDAVFILKTRGFNCNEASIVPILKIGPSYSQTNRVLSALFFNYCTEKNIPIRFRLDVTRKFSKEIARQILTKYNNMQRRRDLSLAEWVDCFLQLLPAWSSSSLSCSSNSEEEVSFESPSPA
jgi:hypothetical protein